MLKTSIFSVLFAFCAGMLMAEPFELFSGIDKPVGQIERPFVWTSKSTPAPWNGRPYNFSIADKFHGYLYFSVDSSTGTGFSDLHFKNDYKKDGFTACANVFYWGDDNRYLNAGVIAGVNPRSTRDNLRVPVSQSPEFWSGVSKITIAFGWCPTNRVPGKIVKFFKSIEIPPSIQSTDTNSAPSPSDPGLSALSIVRQICGWPDSNGNMDNAATGGVDFRSWAKSCDEAVSDAQSRADSEGCSSLGSSWVAIRQEKISTDTCR